MKYAYYPGCSLECSSAAYDISVRAVSERMGIQLVELDDWNCCGATEYFSQDELTACAVIARNLALVEADDQFVEDVRKLGPLNWAENWEENGERFQALEDIVREHEEAMEVPR